MMNELDVMDRLVMVIQTHLNEYLPEGYSIVADQVILDFPDVDKMPYNVSIYVQPEYSEAAALSGCSDEITFRLNVFVLVKRDTQTNLTKKYFAYYNALYYLLRNNTTLDEFISETKVLSVDFFPDIEGNPNVRGSKITVATIFEKDFKGE